MTQQLPHKQRIAAAGVRDRPRQRVCAVGQFGHSADQFCYVVCREPLKRDMTGQLLARETPPQRREGMVDDYIFAAICDNDESRMLARSPRNELECGERGSAGPVQILEDDERGALTGERCERFRQRLEEPLSLSIGVERWWRKNA